MAKLDRAGLVTLAEQRYFTNVDRKNLDAVLGCFAEDAVFAIQSSFTVYRGRDGEIRGMFERLFGYRRVLHTDFETIADAETQAVSSRFRVELEDTDGKLVELHNVNHWYARNGLFQRVYVWMSGANVLT